jgi:putative nucleotidyltransferase with HDIG domain
MMKPAMHLDKPRKMVFSLAQWLIHKRTLGFLVAVVSYVVIFMMVTASIAPKRYDLQVGDLAKETIKATKDVIDEISTQKLIQEAHNSVDIKYKQDEAITNEVLENIHSCFSTIGDIRVEGEKERIRMTETMAPSQQDNEGNDDTDSTAEGEKQLENSFTYSDSFLKEMGNKLPVTLSRNDVLTILSAKQAELDTLKQKILELTSDSLKSGTKEEFRMDQMNKINKELSDPELDISNEVRKLGMGIVSAYLQANMIYDEEATEQARQKAVEAVVPVVYKKGQNIVRESEPVTQAQLQVLDSLGLLKSKAFDVSFYTGIGIIILILLLPIVFYLLAFEKKLVDNIPLLIMLSLIIILSLGVALLVNQIHPYLIPASLGTLLIAILLHSRLALIINMVLAVLIGIMTGNDGGVFSVTMLNVMMISLFGGSIGVYIVNRLPQRNALMLAGVVIGATNFITLLGIGLVTTSDIKGNLLSSLWGLGNGVLSSVLCIGTLPIWENLFNLVTPIKLLELSNPQQPLLKRLLLEAPGTYHHSIIVANLAESAADALGANSLLARVGSYYHDVGKLKRPFFFKENQIGTDNPHDKITPNLSTLIITSHPKDGIQYAKKYKIPRVLQDIILQHHGTSPVLYFYHKAMNADSNEKVLLENFRYEGPKPQTREAAIIMLADTVEAAVRAQSEPSQGRIEGLIRKLIKEKLEDNQLDECDLTLRDLDLIADAFSKVLCGVFHERIEYPDINMKDTAGGKEG